VTTQPETPPEREHGVVTPFAIVRPVAIVVGVLLVLGAVLGLISGSMPEVFLLEAVKNVFWIDNDLNVWAWASALLLTFLALASALSAVVRRVAGRPYGADVVFAVVAGYLSVDESAALHERLGSLGERVGATWTYGWVAVGAPIALVVGLGLLWVGRRIDRTTRRRLVLAGLLYLGGALGVETLGGALYETAGLSWTSVPYILTASLEEALEAAGVLVALWAMLGRVRIAVPGRVELSPEHPGAPVPTPVR
jgi:hypothetical protein